MNDKSYEFLTAEEAKEISDKFAHKNKHNQQIIKIIKKIENDIKKASEKGLYQISYINICIEHGLDVEKIAKHFKNNGFYIDISYQKIKAGFIRIYCVYDMFISWENC